MKIPQTAESCDLLAELSRGHRRSERIAPTLGQSGGRTVFPAHSAFCSCLELKVQPFERLKQTPVSGCGLNPSGQAGIETGKGVEKTLKQHIFAAIGALEVGIDVRAVLDSPAEGLKLFKSCIFDGKFGESTANHHRLAKTNARSTKL